MGRATDYSGESHRGLQSVGRSYPCPLCYLDRLTVLAGNLLNEIDDAAPKLGFVDPDESLCQQEPFGAGKEIPHVGRRGCVFHSVGRTVQVGRALVEERYWYLKDMGDLLQPAGPDAVGAFLVFLHLLVGDAERLGPRRRTLLVPEGYGRFAATGWPRCGWRLSRFSALAGR